MDIKITTNSIQKQFETSTQEIQESLLRNEFFCFQGMFYSTVFYIELSSFLAICLEKKKHFSKTIFVSITYSRKLVEYGMCFFSFLLTVVFFILSGQHKLFLINKFKNCRQNICFVKYR